MNITLWQVILIVGAAGAIVGFTYHPGFLPASIRKRLMVLDPSNPEGGKRPAERGPIFLAAVFLLGVIASASLTNPFNNANTPLEETLLANDATFQAVLATINVASNVSNSPSVGGGHSSGGGVIGGGGEVQTPTRDNAFGPSSSAGGSSDHFGNTPAVSGTELAVIVTVIPTQLPITSTPLPPNPSIQQGTDWNSILSLVYLIASLVLGVILLWWVWRNRKTSDASNTGASGTTRLALITGLITVLSPLIIRGIDLVDNNFEKIFRTAEPTAISTSTLTPTLSNDDFIQGTLDFPLTQTAPFARQATIDAAVTVAHDQTATAIIYVIQTSTKAAIDTATASAPTDIPTPSTVSTPVSTTSNSVPTTQASLSVPVLTPEVTSEATQSP